MDRRLIRSAAFLKEADLLAEREGITSLQAYYKLKAREKILGESLCRN